MLADDTGVLASSSGSDQTVSPATRRNHRRWMFAGLFWLAFWPAVTLLPLGRSPAHAVQGKTHMAATKNLTCESLTVVGPDGRPRAILEGNAEGGRLALYDGRMRCRVSLTLDDSSCPHVSLYDKALHSRISLGLAKNESPMIHINDSHDRTRQCSGCLTPAPPCCR